MEGGRIERGTHFQATDYNLLLVSAEKESWWPGSLRALAEGWTRMEERMKRTDCTGAESYTGCCTSVPKTGQEWACKSVCTGQADKKRRTGRGCKIIYNLWESPPILQGR